MELIATNKAGTVTGYDDHAFEELFKAHFKALHSYASVMLYQDSHAEEIVQSMFVRLWEKRALLDVQISIKAYLYKCVHNDCLNYLKHHKIKTKYQDHAALTMNDQIENTSDKLVLGELQDRLQAALNELPEQCRTIFQMSRFEELKYREIAEALGISIKTVENQMGKALRILRVKLVDFLPIILLFMHYKDL
ncbi:RNA polymerase sigma-70 factor [Flavihumibacter sp. R14]|nr:RNA polymerase sigma-70 factor [Flavihumibacter soli]